MYIKNVYQKYISKMYIKNVYQKCISKMYIKNIYKKCISVFMYSNRYSYQILIKLEFSRHIFEKYSKIKFHENPSSGSRVVPCGQRDGHDEANRGFSKFYQHAQNRYCAQNITPRI